MSVMARFRCQSKTILEEKVRLNEEGKISYLGLSGAGPTFIQTAATVCISWLTCKWKICSLTQDVEVEHFVLFESLGMGIMDYSFLGKGYSSGTFSGSSGVFGDYQAKSERFEARNLKKIFALAESLRAMAKAQGAITAQIAIAWPLVKGVQEVRLPGAKSVVYLEDNLWAKAVNLVDGKVAHFDAAFSTSAAPDRFYPALLRAAWQQ